MIVRQSLRSELSLGGCSRTRTHHRDTEAQRIQTMENPCLLLILCFLCDSVSQWWVLLCHQDCRRFRAIPQRQSSAEFFLKLAHTATF